MSQLLMDLSAPAGTRFAPKIEVRECETNKCQYANGNETPYSSNRVHFHTFCIDDNVLMKNDKEKKMTTKRQ